MVKVAAALAVSFVLGFGFATFAAPASVAGEPLEGKSCLPSGAKCGLDKDCCSKFCKSSNTLRTCK